MEGVIPPTFNLPSLNHLNRSDFENVYEPAEDTYLFVDTLHFEKTFLNELRPRICLEIGGGSGCISACLSQVLTEHAALFVTDINPIAAAVSAETLRCNNANGNVLCTDLTSNFAGHFKGLVDVIVFNPPYVVTPSEEVGSSLIASSWAGGIDGREVLDKFLPSIYSLLSPTGVCYILAIEENKPKELCSYFTDAGMRSAQIITRRKAFNEKLMIIKAVK